MDAGEFGAGLLASPLRRGLDVPENAVLLDALVSAAIPVPEIPVVPLPLPQVLGIFERLTGNPAWRHFELFAGAVPAYEGRADALSADRCVTQRTHRRLRAGPMIGGHGAARSVIGDYRGDRSVSSPGA